MLASLSPLELGRLRMSVGYGTHKRGRPLSPIEVGGLLSKSLEEGASLRDCANAIQLDGTGHIGRFLRILQLPADLQHLVDWGSGKDFIGFTAAVELTRLDDPSDQRHLASAVLSDSLTSKEVREVVQLRKRRGGSLKTCIEDVLNMRPRTERRYVFLGSVEEEVGQTLEQLSQADRNAILESAINRLELIGATGRLGKRFFALVGGESFNAAMAKVGREDIEDRVRSHIADKASSGIGGC